MAGGKFGHGFIAAGAGGTVGGKINGIGGGDKLGPAIRTVTRTILGGTISKLTGGKFANGAGAAALASIMSEAASDDVITTGARKGGKANISPEDIVKPEIDYSTPYDTYGDAVEALNTSILEAKEAGNSRWEYGGITASKGGSFYNSNIVTSHQSGAIYWHGPTLMAIHKISPVVALNHYHPLGRGVVSKAFSDDDMSTYKTFRSVFGKGFQGVYLVDKYGPRKYNGTTEYRGISCKNGIASC